MFFGKRERKGDFVGDFSRVVLCLWGFGGSFFNVGLLGIDFKLGFMVGLGI